MRGQPRGHLRGQWSVGLGIERVEVDAGIQHADARGVDARGRCRPPVRPSQAEPGPVKPFVEIYKSLDQNFFEQGLTVGEEVVQPADGNPRASCHGGGGDRTRARGDQ